MTPEVLFIHPGNHKKTYQALADEYTAIAPPAWTCLLAQYTRNNGYGTALYDVNVEGWDDTTAGTLLTRYAPGLIVIMVYGHNPSASTQTMPSAGKIARDIKAYQKDIPVAMGGTHPSALPERTLREEDIDFCIQGEGPYTVGGLLKYLKGKESIHNIKGLWYRKGDAINFTQPAPLVQDLDKELDGYAFDLLPSLDHYRAHNMHCFQDLKGSRSEDFMRIRSPYVAMNTSLGCPYSCHYCCISAVFGKPSIRYWSQEKVCSWIDTLVNKYKVRNIRFDDELFILSPARVERFCDLLIERGYDLNIWVYGRVDTIPDRLLAKLKAAGVNWICLGIESGNEMVRESVNKRIKKDITRMVRAIQAHDIHVLGNYMFGLPEDTMASMRQTLNVATELNCEYVNFYTVMGYPGSRLYEWASQKEGYLPDTWAGFSQHSYDTRPLPTKYISARDVLAFRDEAFHAYFTNPAYREMMGEKFGRRVLDHLDNMLKIPITRKLLEDVVHV